MSSDTEYVTLVSADNHKFIVMKEVAQISSVIKSSQGFQEGETGKISLDMDGDILECIVEYLYYHYKYKDQAETGNIPEFNIPTHLALELLVKADFLDI
ncbi:BTB/POZ protein [Scheffersomyces amazonensis]|uniref:BTB/POZ protein n=1 Tax=Scheffersomyces amazonensis TaxID=1078765 RepID=UPI00315DBC22